MTCFLFVRSKYNETQNDSQFFELITSYFDKFIEYCHFWKGNFTLISHHRVKLYDVMIRYEKVMKKEMFSNNC